MLINTNVPYAALSRRKNIIPEDGRIVTGEICRRVYKCNCAVVGFVKKLLLSAYFVIHSVHILTINAPNYALNKIHSDTSIKLLHVSAPECHHQGVI
jgi:hypothetical protein